MQHDVASPEGDADPVPAGDVRHARDRALDPHRLAGGLVGQAANVHVERIAGLQTLGHDRLDGGAIGDGGNQHVGQVLRDHLLEHPRRRARAVGMVGQHHRPGAACHRLLGERHALRDGMHRRRLQQRLAPAPCPRSRHRRQPCAQARACRWSSPEPSCRHPARRRRGSRRRRSCRGRARALPRSGRAGPGPSTVRRPSIAAPSRSGSAPSPWRWRGCSRRGWRGSACEPRARLAGGCRSAGSTSRRTRSRPGAGTRRPRCHADRRCRR